MPVFYEENNNAILILFAVTLYLSFFIISLGVTMETLHYSSTTVTMAIRYNIQADDFGVFLLGFGTGMLIISGIAYTYVNRKSVVTGNVR
ncbi:uncharacterized protein TNCT_622541 [Trichonephila clavata]|uniref:Uncharacterized protein n=1 Tax=Trichonephila clavata TaxID=2740835 RepID=A0A8X6FRB8_TRICU|nr:uncharacterized protein TNCT_622541 [Trichonephila clavata]